MAGKSALLVLVSMAALSGAAHAAVSISSKPTANMDCEPGVCTATAQKAVLNVTDLTNMLASGDVAVKTGTVAKDINLDQPLTWTSTSRLTLDAQQSVSVKKQITVAEQGALTVTTNDGGKHGEFIIAPERGSVQFWDLGSSLIIDGNSYTLVGDITTLAADIAANPSGYYALAKPYDASVDGAYATAAVETNFKGTFDGLGNAISNLTFEFPAIGIFTWVGLFLEIDNGGLVRNTRIVNGQISGHTCSGATIALLAATNSFGTIKYSSVTGNITITGECGEAVGGLVAGNGGLIANSFSRIKLIMTNARGGAGALSAENFGTISQSFSDGSIVALENTDSSFGGLAAENGGAIINSFQLGAVHEGKDCCGSGNSFGGMVGQNDSTGQVSSSYAAGKMQRGHSGDISAPRGGVIGMDNASPGHLSNAYWDLDKGIRDPSQGAGNIPNDPGITGLTDVQFKSALPAGFDPKIWGQSPNINDGYPYLLANPPR